MSEENKKQNNQQRPLCEWLGTFLPTDKDRLILSFNSHDAKSRKISVAVSVLDVNGKTLCTPFAIRGSYEELSASLWMEIERYRKNVVEKVSSLDALEKEIAEKEKALKKKEDKLSKGAKVDQGRMLGGVDSQMVDVLTSAIPKDDEFKKALGESNFQTILHATQVVKDESKGKMRFNKLSSEVKKIIGTSAEEMGIVYGGSETEDGTVETAKDKQMSLLKED